MRDMDEDVRKEIAELRKMIADYIMYLKEFTMKTLETMRVIDRRLAALEAKMIRGELEISVKPATPTRPRVVTPKPEVKPEPKPVIPEREIPKPPEPAKKPSVPAMEIAPKIKVKPVPKVKPKMPSPFKEKKEEEELPPDSMAKVAEALSEILDV